MTSGHANKQASKPARKKPDYPVIPEDAELVACLDGPLVNQWFYLAEWHERRAAEERMRHTPYSGAALGYVPVRDEMVDHPSHPTAKAHALAYRPAKVAAALRAKSA
jgi:hypothetical protein